MLAVLFLLLPLGMAWDLERQAMSHDFIVPVTLLSILCFALPYLSAASVRQQLDSRTDASPPAAAPDAPPVPAEDESIWDAHTDPTDSR